MQTNLAGICSNAQYLKCTLTTKKVGTLLGSDFFVDTGRFEELTAKPRWGFGRIRLDGFDTLRSAKGRTASNLAGTSPGDGSFEVDRKM